MTSYRSLASMAGLLAALAAPVTAQIAPRPAYTPPSVPPRSIAWTNCSEEEASPTSLALLGARLRCGSLSVPRDHHRPADGNIRLKVVRVAAADPSKRQGALFVNPGGPGGDPGEFVVGLTSVWMHALPDDPTHGEKKRLSDSFDLIAVVPRGMPGSTPLSCEGELPHIRMIMLDRTPASIAAWDLRQRRVAEACRVDPLHPYISTEQTVYDLDLVRRSLGEVKFNFYGVSYGTWLGAWYGATYPDHVGRMLFDSAMDYTKTMEENYLASGKAEQERFDRLVTAPAIAASATYRLGADAAAVHATLRSLLYRVALTWAGEFESPESLIAAVAMSSWLRANPALEYDAMSTLIENGRFSVMPDVNMRVRAEAQRMQPELYAPLTDTLALPLPQPPQPAIQLPTMPAMIVAVPCNDTPSTSDAGIWQATIADYAARYPAAQSGDFMNACVFWRGPNAIKPAIERLARAGKILFVAAEFDTNTPVSGALNMINALPNASMIVLRGAERHGLFTLTDEACIERTGARFLLDGRTPTAQLTECHSDAAGAPHIERFTDPTLVKGWRGRLERLVGQRPRLTDPVPLAAD